MNARIAKNWVIAFSENRCSRYVPLVFPEIVKISFQTQGTFE